VFSQQEMGPAQRIVDYLDRECPKKSRTA
jgi:hypothetical protein